MPEGNEEEEEVADSLFHQGGWENEGFECVVFQASQHQKVLLRSAAPKGSSIRSYRGREREGEKRKSLQLARSKNLLISLPLDRLHLFAPRRTILRSPSRPPSSAWGVNFSTSQRSSILSGEPSSTKIQLQNPNTIYQCLALHKNGPQSV